MALVQRLEQTISELQVENKRLKQQLEDRDGQHPTQHPTQRLEDEYSLEAEDKRVGGQRRKKQKSSRRGRQTTDEKLAAADRPEDVFIVRLSMDKVCRQLEFFWGLKLAKSQADA